MECVVVSSLLGIVEQLQLLPLLLLQKPPPPHNNNNPCLILPHHDEDTQIMVSSLKDKLHFLQAYLDQSQHKSCDDNPEAEEEVLLLHKEIRYVAAKAEDEIEWKLGKVLLYLAAPNLQGDCKVAIEAAACEDLHQSLQHVVKDFECLELHIRDHPSLQAQLLENYVRVRVRDGGSSKYDLDDENIMIGVEDGVEEIKGWLIHSSSRKLQVVSICGLAGTGRTTLAKTAFEDPSIVSHFDIRAWTVASLQYSKRKLLIAILGCIVSLSNEEEISKKDDEQLGEQLRKVLMGQRYLIVIDDLWTTHKAWDELRTSFPDDSNGSRVLIITRILQLAKFASSGGMCIHKTRLLDLEESWNLFTKNACNGKCCLPSEFELIGRSIVEGCNGIPLLIVLIGGLLPTLNNSPKQWQDFEREFNSSSGGWFDTDRVLQKIEVCYNYLPSQLKACFLYLGAFPENTEIHVKKLIELWIAEGILKADMNKSFEEIAYGYLCDLINTRLVQVHKRNLDGKIKSCMLHSLLLDFCLTKSRKDNIMAMSTEYHKFLEGCRWISCLSGCWPITPGYFIYSSLETRSLLYFGESLYLAKCWLMLPSLKLLRVLDLSLIKYWHGMPSEIVDLIHLRYLALTTIGSLYNFQLFKLQCLQTLILSSWTKKCQLQLPRDVLDLPWLRHACFDKGSSSYLPTLVQENLQTLSWFKVTGRDSRTTNFTKVPNLKELGIYIEGEVLSNALDSLSQLRKLEKLKVKMGRAERFNLPNSFPSNLKQLTLSNTYLSWEDIDIIGKLPNLDLLKLKDFAFCGPEWKPRDGGFLQLRFFLIERSDLEHWNANANHFPVLERLILRYCWDLEKLPNDFEEVYTLQLIELDNCCSSLVTSAMEIQNWQQESGNEALVVRDVTKAKLPTDESSEKRSESAI